MHENLIAVPPDGGWGWVIVCVCAYAFTIIDVPALGFQVVSSPIQKLLNIGRSQASLIFATYTMTMFLAGPVAGGFCNRFGFRTTTILGSVMMIIGLWVSYFATEFYQFFIFYGVIAGSGSSFILMMSSVALGFWFESKRAIVMGLASSANGICAFTVSLWSHISVWFGWRTCFLFWSGLMVILIILSFLLGPPPMVELEADIPLVPSKDEELIDITRISVMRPLQYPNANTQVLAEEKVKDMVPHTGVAMGETGPRPSIMVKKAPIGMGRWCPCFLCFDWCQHHVGARPLYRKDIFYEGNIDYAAESSKVNAETFTLAMAKLPTRKDVKQELECPLKIPEALTRGVSEMIDFSLFKSKIFLLILGASVAMYTVRYVPILLIRRVHKGHLSEGSQDGLVYVMGMGSIIFRAGIGFFLFAFKNVSSLTTTIVLTFLSGLVICGIAVTHWMPYQLLVCFMAGAFPSVLVTLRSIIIIDLLGLDKLTSITGILFFMQGVASFCGMPVAEILSESIGTPIAGMLFAGIFYFISFLFFMLIHFMKPKQDSIII